MADMLKTASGKALVSYLEKNVDPGVQKEVLGLVKEVVSEVLAGGGVDKENAQPSAPKAAQADISTCLYPAKDLNLLNPRGKFDIGLSGDNLVINNAKTSLSIPVSAITSVAILDNLPGDTKDRILLFIAINRSAGVMNGKQRLDAIIIQTTGSAQLSVPTPDGPPLEGVAAVVLCQMLGKMNVPPNTFCSPDLSVFSSAKGNRAVAANMKVNSGWLFPMASAFCFIERPALFVPHTSIAKVELQRANGVSSTWDLLLHTTAGEKLEFGQIDRAELGRLQSYISRCRLKVAGEEEEEQAGGSRSAAVAGGQAGPSPMDADEDDDDDEDDEDFDPEAPDSDDEDARPAKRKRTAGGGPGDAGASGSAAAEEQVDDEDEDEDDEDYSADDDDDDDVELEDEDGISAVQLKELMQEDGSKGKGKGGKSGKGKGTAPKDDTGKGKGKMEWSDEGAEDDDDDD